MLSVSRSRCVLSAVLLKFPLVLFMAREFSNQRLHFSNHTVWCGWCVVLCVVSRTECGMFGSIVGVCASVGVC